MILAAAADPTAVAAIVTGGAGLVSSVVAAVIAIRKDHRSSVDSEARRRLGGTELAIDGLQRLVDSQTKEIERLGRRHAECEKELASMQEELAKLV